MKRAVKACSFTLVLALSAFGGAPSPIADAAMKGNVPAVKALIQQGADVNALKYTMAIKFIKTSIYSYRSRT